jgi:glycosyltransferase involved in cell wall biosynthesis
VKPLRFCFITTFYPPWTFGGDGMTVQRMARGLVGRGHHVTVIHDVDAWKLLAPSGPEPVLSSVDDGVELVSLRSPLGPLSPFLTQQTGRPVANMGRIRSIADRGDFDVVHFHNISLVGGPGVLSVGGDAVRVYTAHEHWLVCPTHVLWRHDREPCTGRECLRCTLAHRRPPQLYRYTGFLERQLRNVDIFIALSEFSREKHREFGFPYEMTVLPPFLAERVEPPFVSESPHSRPYVLFAGRLERMKGLDDVIPVFRDFPEVDLLVAGRGNHGAALRQLASGAPGVRFLGYVPPEVTQGYMQHALAVVAPTVGFETFGLTLVESFRQGTPVIARRQGPYPEMVERSGGGILFETPDELRAALATLANDPRLREDLGAAGRRAFLRHWSEDAVLPRYLELVGRQLEENGARELHHGELGCARS